jgi:hypothetical protein
MKITITQEINRADLPNELVKIMVDMAFNPMSWYDGYTIADMRRKYGEGMIVAVDQLVIKPMKAERAGAEAQLAAIHQKYVR